MKLYIILAALLCMAGCRKSTDLAQPAPAPTSVSNDLTLYTIHQGQNYCDKNAIQLVTVDTMQFTARFDSSAIYQTADPVNQYDINKLYGFSDNNYDHHQYSARFGWRWSDGALRLFAYVYNEGVMESSELTAVAIGADIRCAIVVLPGRYVFVVNGTAWTMPRKATTPAGSGYRLYPYFGGDETAPHEITIRIKPGHSGGLQ